MNLELASSPSTTDRKRMAKQGIAMPDGSFPIPDITHLKAAIRAVGRAPEAKRPAVRRHIIKRARALNAVQYLPDTW